MAAKKQAKTTKKKTSKRSSARTGGKAGSKKKVTRAAGKKTTKKTVKKASPRAGGGKKTAKKTKASRSAATKKLTKKKTTARKSTKKTSKKSASVKKGAKKASGAKKRSTKKVSTRSTKKQTKKKTTKKTTKQTSKKSSKTKPSDEAPTGLRQLSQAVAPGSKPTLTLSSTSQELHTRAADTGAGDSLIPPETKKPRRRRMPKRDLEKYRQLLMAKRAELYGDVRTMRSDVLGNKSSGNLSHTPQHMADQGTDNYEQEFTLGLVEFERRLLNEIDEALGRIADGTYGICQLTGRSISAARLQAKPWAKYCIDAARQLEQAGRR
ncbi:MAG: TraR/DksA family transcriptional regulator [Phycisphaerales bacterium JB038]